MATARSSPKTNSMVDAGQQFLGAVPLLSRVPATSLAQLAGHLVPRKYRTGQIIFHQGDPGASLHIIESGEVKIAIMSEEGEELLVAILGRGDFFGELALLDGHPRTATASAVGNISTLTLSHDEFLAFLEGSSRAAISVAVALATRLRESDERLSESVFLDLSQRLARCLVRLVETFGQQGPEGIRLDIPLSQSELAAFVGATRQSVNKMLSHWERAGLLRREGRTLILPRPERLYRPD